MRVLVAEDDRQMSDLICAILQSAGHNPVPVFDGASAMMAAVKNPQPDLILLDLAMPAGTGQITLSKLKQSAKTSLIPVIVVSAAKDALTRTQIFALGAATFIEKPITPDSLLAAVEAFGSQDD